LSMYFQNFKAAHPFATRLHWLGHRYQAYRQIMSHWKQVLPLPMYEIQYEALVSDPTEEIGRLLSFCGVDWDPACLRFHENNRVVRTASYHQVRQPLYTRSVRRADQYKPWLGPLMHTLGDETADQD